MATFDDRKASIRSGEAIAFVGAGLSARLGYGNWRNLVKKLGKAMSRQVSANGAQAPSWTGNLDDLVWIAEIYRERLKDTTYARLLRNHFAPNSKTDVDIDLFAQLNFGQIVTTNYDTAIEDAQSRHGRLPQVVRWWIEEDVKILMESLSRPQRQPHLVYLHGRYDVPPSIVLSERDYVSCYAKSDFTVRKLFAIFSTRRVVFFGFSLSDPDIAAIFRQVNSIHRSPRHFALLGLEPGDETAAAEATRERLKRKFGISPIFFPVDKATP